MESTIKLDNWANTMEYFFEKGWTDGLPIVPPTKELVEAMLSHTTRDPDEIVAIVPPRWVGATVRDVAINAVMAGCKPEYLPVVIASVEAACDERFNLNGIQATTHVVSPLMIVNGPIRNELSINSKYNVFGQGFRANATIGRAFRLVLMNLGGGIPGETDQSCFGHPGKFSYCIAENEEESPWESYHVEKGYNAEDSTVTLFGGEAPHSCSNHVSNDPYGICMTIADTMATLGNNNQLVSGEIVVVIGPEHAETIKQSGWTKEDIRYYLYQNARNNIEKLRFYGRYGKTWNKNWPKWIDRDNPEERVPVVPKPENIHILYAGGPAGRFSIVVPGWGRMGGQAVTKLIRK
ncbi:hypothetical protein [Ammoniphilus resinae]|uniref:Uncharacterized protein n=1 Tax=Ammoniphilus resinae TaxID=861532 RepID=A0ABS4GL54_9BACL|nr:hypothetical protein [Ammoniphilus resinae]MBP1931001.1 hypothetical protein [Ammoniphilus resinae]